eukprot:5515955-Amphidinium_carterae.1
MHHDNHHGVYYYNYYYYQYLQHHIPEDCVCYLDNLMSRGHWIGLAWVLTFVAFILKQNVDLVKVAAHGFLRVVGGGIRLSARGVRCILGGAREDGATVWRASLFFLCELILIAARRLPCCRGRLRKAALRMRPHSAASITTGSPVGARGALDNGERTPNRRSLAQVHADMAASSETAAKQEFVLGARKMRSTRLKAPRHPNWRTTYNPQGGHGSCLFAALANAAAMRRLIRTYATELLMTEKQIYKSLTLQQLLKKHGISPQRFVGTLHHRWGNSIDIMIAAHMMQKNIQLVDIRTAKPIITVKAGSDTDRLHQIGYARYHFVVGHTRINTNDEPGVFDRLVHIVQRTWQWLRRDGARARTSQQEVREGAGHVNGLNILRSNVFTYEWRGDKEMVGKCFSVNSADSAHRNEYKILTSNEYIQRWSGKETMASRRLNVNKVLLSDVCKQEESVHLVSSVGGYELNPSVAHHNEYRTLSSNVYNQAWSGEKKTNRKRLNEHKISSSDEYTQGRATHSVRISSDVNTAHCNEYKVLLNNVYNQQWSGAQKMDRSNLGEAHCNEYKVLMGNVYTQERNGEKKMGRKRHSEHKISSSDEYTQGRATHSGNNVVGLRSGANTAHCNEYKVQTSNGYTHVWSGNKQMGRIIFDEACHSEHKVLSSNVYTQEWHSRYIHEMGVDYVTGGGKTGNVPDDAIPKAMPKKRQARKASEVAGADAAQQRDEEPVMKVRRYPFAKSDGGNGQNTGGQASSSGQQSEALVPPKLALIYHGSFCPFHPGHMATYQSASRFLTKRGWQVEHIIIGVTTEKQLRRKIGVTPFALDSLRANIARKVLQDCGADRANVTVDSRAASSGTELETRHADKISANSKVLYVVGSDVVSRPGPYTIVVQRSEEDAAGAEPGANSTAIREALAQNTVPGIYGPLAAAALKAVLDGIPLVETPQPTRNRRRVETVNLVSAEPAAPEQVEIVDETPPAARAGRGLPVLDDMDPRILQEGAMRLRRPVHVNLSAFWHHCVVPLTALLRLVPMGVTRRAGDNFVRVPYMPASPPYRPVTVFTDVDQNNELRISLGEVGANVLSFQYLAFMIKGMLVEDKDPCSQHGVEFRATFDTLVYKADRACEVASIRAATILMDASHLVLLTTRFYRINVVELAMDIAGQLNAHAAKESEQPNSALYNHNISFVPEAAKCDEFKRGGNAASKSCSGHRNERMILVQDAHLQADTHNIPRCTIYVSEQHITKEMDGEYLSVNSDSSAHRNEYKVLMSNEYIQGWSGKKMLAGRHLNENKVSLSDVCKQAESAQHVRAEWCQGGGKKRSRSDSRSASPPPEGLPHDPAVCSDCVRVCSFSPPSSEGDPVAACVCWIIAQELDKCVCAQHVRVIAALWIRMAAKQHYNMAGTPIVHLANECGLTKQEYCDQ